MKPLNIPFNVTYIIKFSGITRSDGIHTVTPNMILDKLQGILDKMIAEGHIVEFSMQIAPKKSKKVK